MKKFYLIAGALALVSLVVWAWGWICRARSGFDFDHNYVSSVVEG
jgi:hypothetical protein